MYSWGHSNGDQGIYQEARAGNPAQKLRAAQIILKETPPLGAGSFILRVSRRGLIQIDHTTQ